MSDEELLAVLTATGAPVPGPAGLPLHKRRDEVHRDGDWHAAFHLWVLADDAVLFQRRHADAAAWPSCLCSTVGGHLLAGEGVLDGLREVEEELGEQYDVSVLIPLGVFTVEDPDGEGTINREHQHVYAVRDDRPLNAFTRLDPGEVAGLTRVDLAAFKELVTSPDAQVPAQSWDGHELRDVTVSAADLVPAVYLRELPALFAGALA